MGPTTAATKLTTAAAKVGAVRSYQSIRKKNQWQNAPAMAGPRKIAALTCGTEKEARAHNQGQ